MCHATFEMEMIKIKWKCVGILNKFSSQKQLARQLNIFMEDSSDRVDSNLFKSRTPR